MTIDDDVNNFINFMKRHIIKKGSDLKPTHTLMGPLHPTKANFRGAYHISGSSYDVFMKLYKAALGRMQMHVVERPTEIGPIVIDIDFNVPNSYKERQYCDHHIEEIVKVYNDLFKKYLIVDDNDIKAFIFEKPTPTYDKNKKIYKDGFHIIYPEIPLDVKKRYFFFDKAKREITKMKLFSDIPVTNSYDKILDSSVIVNNGILMYGSNKEGRPPYVLTKIFNNDMSIDSIDNYDDDDDLVSILSTRRHSPEDELHMRDKTKNNTFYKDDSSDSDETESESEDSDKENIIDTKKKKKKYSSDEESLGKQIDKVYNKYDSSKKKIKQKNKNYLEDDEEIDEERMKLAVKKAEKEYGMSYDHLSEIKLAKGLVKILKKKRARDYDDWIRVGWALKNISDTLLPTFIEFSKQCKEKYQDGCCEKIWSNANCKKSGYTISSLHWWAKCDNPDGYLKVMRERVKSLIFTAESGTHDDIANVLKEMYKHIYRCVNINKKVWYEFQEHRWVCIEQAYTLYEKISSDLTKEFCILHAYYLQEASVKESIDQDDLVAKSKKITRIYEKLKTSGFIKSVIECCERKFYDSKRHFEELLNTNKELIGFDNGVYDLKNRVFRNGCPDDLVSMSVGYDYVEYNKDSEEIQEIEKYFSQVQREDDMREYVLRLISSFLDGKSTDQKFVLWTGSGCHAKDELIKMYDGTTKKIQDINLGEYVLGINGKRKVNVCYKGTAKMYNINAHDEKKTKFIVNGNHRLALRSHFQRNISETYDDIYEKKIFWVTYHVNIEKYPTEFSEKFYSYEDAKKFMDKLEDNSNFIRYNEIIPVSVADILASDQTILKYYKLFKHNHQTETDCSFDITDASETEFYGIELDGDKKYVMENGYVTYNSNGKSTTIDLIHNTLGEYSGILPVTVLTKKRGASGAAIPELADKRGKRFLVIQEPEHDDTMYVGQMKELTAGNDKIYARALYGDPFTYKPQFKLVLICNKLPNIPSSDGGTWRRLRVTQWESEFVDFEPIESYQFRKDYELSRKMEEWAQPFIWLLINKYYPRYVKYSLQEPKKVTQYTDKYKKDSDFFYEFLDKYVDTTKDEKDSETIDFVWRLFKNWYKEAYTDKLPKQKDFTGYMESQKYKMSKNLIYGIKIISGDE